MRTSGFAVFRGRFSFGFASDFASDVDAGSDDDEAEVFWMGWGGFSRTALVENARAFVPSSERANMREKVDREAGSGLVLPVDHHGEQISQLHA